VLEAVSVQEGVNLSADHEVRGLIQFENVLSLTVLDSVFEGLVGGGLAPVVFDKSAGLFYNCSFVGNSQARTGGIYAAGGSLMHVYDSVFADNEGESYGAVGITSGCTTLFKKTKFNGNRGGQHHDLTDGFVSGAVFSYHGSVAEFEECEFRDNVGAGGGAGAFTGLKRAVVKFRDCVMEGNYGHSGALSLTDLSHGTLNNTLIMRNGGTPGGAPIFLDLRSDLVITKSHFTNNEGDSGVIAAHHNANLEIDGSSFVNNTGAKYGGAVSSFMGGEVVITDCKFESNLGRFGGAIYQDRVAKATFNDSRFFSNAAVIAGGAIFQKDVRETGIHDCEFVDNDGRAVGGALAQIGCGDADWLSPNLQHLIRCGEGAKPACEKVEVAKSVFDGNTAGQLGSSMFHDRCKDVSVISTDFPDEEMSVVQERCVERKFERNSADTQISVVLRRCPEEQAHDRRLLTN